MRKINIYIIETAMARLALGEEEGRLRFSIWTEGEWEERIRVRCEDAELCMNIGVSVDAAECVLKAERLVGKYMEGLRSEEERERWGMEVAELTVKPLFGTEFQRRVWNECAKVGYGERETYGGLARRIGMKGAARAVGGALHINPFELFVPCHRIVRGDGVAGEYASGRWMKEWLLRLEGRFARQCEF